MKFLDVQHPFFRPLWRRLALVVFCMGLFLFEIVLGNPFFGVLIGAVGLYCVHQFFIAFDPTDPE